MAIDINPTEVMRSADTVDLTARGLLAGEDPGHPGNDGFLLSEAIVRFSSAMQTTSSQAATSTSSVAQRLDGTARLLRSVDDDVAGIHDRLLTRVQ